MKNFKLRKYLKFFFLLDFFFFSFFLLQAQTKFFGKITDEQTGENLAFVNIIYNSKNFGTTTDIEGNFVIDDFGKIDFLKISCIGYKTKIISKEEIRQKTSIKIKLSKEEYFIQEVEIFPGKNPAHRIIEQVILNSDKNNPEKIRSFSYVAYNRMHFTVDFSQSIKHISTNSTTISTDSIIEIDTLFDQANTEVIENDSTINNKLNTTKQKSKDKNLFEIFDKQHLFLMESISERKYKFPNNNKEIVLAQRMSGLKNPVFMLLTSQLQSMSFYSDYIHILGKNYLSPISKGSTKKYFFQLEDTLFSEKGDTTFIISYRPLKNKNFEGVQGVLHVNTNGYAIQSVTAKPYEKHPLFDVNIQQKFEFIKDTQWFPVQLNTDLIFNSLTVAADSIAVPIVGIGKCYISDIQLDADFKRREFNQIEIEVKPEANKKDEIFWDKYRYEPLSEKDKKTYIVIDSLGKKVHLDQLMDIMEILASGNIPIKFININLSSIYWWDNYQKNRLGLGLSTNDRLTRYVSLNGYFAYSFGNKKWNYGGGIKIKPFPFHKSKFEISFKYSNDVEICDNFNYYSDNQIQLVNSIIGMFQNEMDFAKKYETSVSFIALKYLKAKIQFSVIDKTIIDKNRYKYKYEIPDNFFINETGLYLRYAYKEKYMQTPKGNFISLGTNYPIIHLNIIKSVSILNFNNKYWKFEATVLKSFLFRNIGKTSIFANGAYIVGDSPYSNLYMITGTNSWLNFDNVFNTMKINEFVSDRYASIFLYHNFKSLLIKTKKFAPEIVIMTAAGWGDSQLAKENPDLTDIKIMNKGYFESGLQINYIINYKKTIGYGIGVYYRYGKYHFLKEINNWTFKLTLNMKLE
ncbi:MAG: DUF5686 and carboxypeptidase regulatory-like domain-containing protein [Bacteroidales bacterium]|jgi:hypothetical protein|nr:DUF5686 and carboxypeptidase regulatory-like domain-containing protein [Bacteroidales bacterium]